MKICTKCKGEKSEEDFYKRKTARDGLQSACKQCEIKRSIEYQKRNPEVKKRNMDKWIERHAIRYGEILRKRRFENPEKYREFSRKRRSTEEYKIWHKEYYKSSAKKWQARRKIAWIKERDKLDCECEYPDCKHIKLKIEAHHWDYDKPLEVAWFCSRHHALADKVTQLLNN